MTVPDATPEAEIATVASMLAMSYGSHVSPPRGGQDWRAAEQVVAWAAQRDAQIKAEALREAADAGTSYLGYETDSGMAWVYLRARADRVAAGAQP